MTRIGIRPTAGRTLIELIVAVALGLLLSAAVLSAYLGVRLNTRVVDESALLHDNARFAQRILARHLRHAGYTPIVTGDPSVPILHWGDDPAHGPYAFGCRGAFATPLGAAAPACAPGDGDQLEVRFAGGGADDADGAGTDCLGQRSPGELTISRFYVAVNAASGRRALYCLGSGNHAPQPIVSGVEQLDVWFGLDPDSNDAVAAPRWLRADAVSPDAWAAVRAVRVCLVVASEQGGIVIDPATYTYRDCFGSARHGDSQAIDPDAPSIDGRLRRAYTMTVVLRNRTGAVLPVWRAAS